MRAKKIENLKTLKLFLIISLICITSIAQAQDVIVKKDNSTILSKVTKIGETEIEYKKWTNLDGPTYAISRSEVISINYQNGEVDKFDECTNNHMTQSAPYIGRMERDGNGLELNGRELADDEVRVLVGEENYQTYLSARKQINAGRVFTVLFPISLGSALLLGAASRLNNDVDLLVCGYVIGGFADVSFALMCILKGVGKGRMNWVADEYNRINRGYSYSYSLSPSIMASKTPQLQNSYGLGVTFSLKF